MLRRKKLQVYLKSSRLRTRSTRGQLPFIKILNSTLKKAKQITQMLTRPKGKKKPDLQQKFLKQKP